MTTLLIVISFLIHGLSLFCIVLLYMQLSRVKELEKKQQQTIREMEEIVLAYVTEIKEQNDDFFMRLNQPKEKSSQPFASTAKKTFVSSVDLKSEPTESLTELFDEEKQINDSDTKVLKKQRSNEDEDEHNELSLEQIKEKAIFLEKKGLTIEEIAKNLHRGKTEIELMLQFRQES
ncbi:hypothetical protein [Bacillus sp. CGMCC 1.16541]|uniref:hypothetical protein n=1 Tax=Bacillus sp. CGMCC 1.16541 TaxID=2185143 RepID=UPI000D7307ED|nr:hypothetical protein [Bacillus sp. CGMCC 1.16541]